VPPTVERRGKQVRLPLRACATNTAKPSLAVPPCLGHLYNHVASGLRAGRRDACRGGQALQRRHDIGQPPCFHRRYRAPARIPLFRPQDNRFFDYGRFLIYVVMRTYIVYIVSTAQTNNRQAAQALLEKTFSDTDLLQGRSPSRNYRDFKSYPGYGVLKADGGLGI